MRIDISQFKGIAPRIDPRALSEGFAQRAINCDLRGGVLAPMRGPRVVMASPVTNALSIYKFGWQSTNETNWWFVFNQDVDVVNAAYPGDTEERTYFTGAWPTAPSTLKKTRLGMANTGVGPYPAAYLDGSIPAPVTLPAVSASGGSTSVEPEVRVYVETFVTSWGEESEPGPASARVTVNQGGTVSVTNLSLAPSGNNAVTHRRLYRSSFTGNDASDAQLVVELPIGTTSYSDALGQGSLGDTLATRGWDAAPTGLGGLIAHPQNFLLGFKGFDVYASEPGAPYAWPLSYEQPAGSPVVALGMMGQTVVVLTKDLPMIGVGSSPEDIQLQRAEVGNNCRSCISKRSVVSAPGAVFYGVRGGIAVITPSGAKLATDAYMTEQEFSAYSPASMLGALWGNRYIGFHSGGGLIYDPEVEGLVETTVTATARHENDGRLYLCSGANIAAFGEGSPLSYTWKSRKYHSPRLAAVACGKVIADSYPVTISLIQDGAPIATKIVASSADFTMPMTVPGREFEIEITGTSNVRRVTLAESVEELRDVGA
jgi:hypothetical protein